jgi:acetyltransferase-like isoleucine patch superfamily enzyme
MNKLWFYIHRLLEKWYRFYRKRAFLGQIGSTDSSVKILGKIYVNASNLRVGSNVTIYPGVYFWGNGEIIIGNNVHIGIGTIIFARNKVIIGNDTIIAGQCYIIDSDHNMAKEINIQQQTLDVALNGIQIGNDVWIAAGCKIIKGAKINNGAVIGAMSLVNSEIEENGIAFGIPARVKKQRE